MFIALSIWWFHIWYDREILSKNVYGVMHLVFYIEEFFFFLNMYFYHLVFTYKRNILWKHRDCLMYLVYNVDEKYFWTLSFPFHTYMHIVDKVVIMLIFFNIIQNRINMRNCVDLFLHIEDKQFPLVYMFAMVSLFMEYTDGVLLFCLHT